MELKRSSVDSKFDSDDASSFMDLESLLWAIAFSFILIVSNMLWNGVRSYLVAQPSGEIPLYLAVFKDLTVVIQISATFHCCLVVFTRFNIVTDFLCANRFAFMAVCTLVECIHLMGILHVGCFCLVRLMCLKNIEFTEVNLGEMNIRRGILTFGLVCQLGVVIAYNVVSNDSLNGPNAIVVTQVAVKPGDDVRFFL